jgi:hypothetical protein
LRVFFSWLRQRRRRLTDTLAQRVHQIDDILSPGPRLGRNRFSRPLAVDELDQRGFVLIFEFCRLESPRLLVDDVLGQVEHVLRDFDVLNIVGILCLRAHFVGVAQQCTHQSLVEGFKCDDVFAVGQHDPSDRDLVHLADGLPDHRKGIVPTLPSGHR